MRKYFLLLSLLFIGFVVTVSAQRTVSTDEIISKVNELRSEDHYCGRKFMPATDPVSWNKNLFKSARSHASEMKRFKYFDHFSKKGESIGVRLEKFGYDWVFAGENIAVGQKSLDETLQDWLESKTHCEVMLSRHVKEIAIAKAGKYRVMHLGRRG